MGAQLWPAKNRTPQEKIKAAPHYYYYYYYYYYYGGDDDDDEDDDDDDDDDHDGGGGGNDDHDSLTQPPTNIRAHAHVRTFRRGRAGQRYYIILSLHSVGEVLAKDPLMGAVHHALCKRHAVLHVEGSDDTEV